MKKIFNLKTTILASLMVIAGSATTFAQCDKKVTFTASTSTYLNDKGAVEKTKNEETIVTLDNKEVNITTGGRPELAGVVKTYTCNWVNSFKTGKSVISTVMVDGGSELHAIITIEGKDGKVTLTFEAAEMPGKKIVLIADKFE
ncbi:hypothetical protein ACVW0P_002906 [Mucilaginibacter sp. UYNi724]